MAKIYEIRELAYFFHTLRGSTRESGIRALLRTSQLAERIAKKNARDNFKGTRERPKRGFLMNAIFSGFEVTGRGLKESTLANAVVGVRSQKGKDGTKPYGRIQEYGGTIKPKTAKNLWIPLVGPKSSGDAAKFRNLTPRDFVKALKRSEAGKTGHQYRRGSKVQETRGEFAMFPTKGGQPMAWFVEHKGSGRSARTTLIPLFMLRKRVVIPARPYVGPAITYAMRRFSDFMVTELRRKGAP